MRLSNHEKHKIAVNLLSDYLLLNKYEHMILSKGGEFDIYIPVSESRIKVICNYSNSINVKVSKDFETKEGVLYLVIKPTRKNIHGFSSVGGDKTVVDKSIKSFNEKSPKNVQTELLKCLSTKKYIENGIQEVKEKTIKRYEYKCISPISKSSNLYISNVQVTGFIPAVIRPSNQLSHC